MNDQSGHEQGGRGFRHPHRAEATPSSQEITRIRRLINRITTGLNDLTDDERAQVDNAVATVRRHRTVMLGMPRSRPAIPDLRSGALA
jgi:hypothetical protein